MNEQTASDPVAPIAERAIAHLNADHPDSLLDMVRAFGGQPDATAATCTGADAGGLDLVAQTPAGEQQARVEYSERLTTAEELRPATVKLAYAARDALGADSAQSS